MFLINIGASVKGKSKRRHFFFHFIFFSLCCFYTKLVFATCTGVGCSCSVGTTAVAFGNYNPTSATPVAATGNVAVTCSASTGFSASYVISLSAGNSGSFATRFMSFTTNQLNYNLYTQVAHTTIWGDGTSGTVTVSDSYTTVATSQLRNYTVYGLVPASQAKRAGSYTDTITVTVTY